MYGFLGRVSRWESCRFRSAHPVVPLSPSRKKALTRERGTWWKIMTEHFHSSHKANSNSPRPLPLRQKQSA